MTFYFFQIFITLFYKKSFDFHLGFLSAPENSSLENFWNFSISLKNRAEHETAKLWANQRKTSKDKFKALPKSLRRGLTN